MHKEKPDNAEELLESRLRQVRETMAAPDHTRFTLMHRLFGPAEPALSFGRYTLLRPLGEGAMGRVYEAADRRRDQRVALKIFRNFGPNTVQLLKREFRALSGIVHPNLVVFYDLCVWREDCFFTMELVDGVDFVSYVRSGDADVPAAVRRARLQRALYQLAGAVRALHAAGKVHRDLKPSNVMVTSDTGRVVVLDFGLITTSMRSDATFTGQVVGTPAYMAPEQFEADPVTPASDCYAIGGILYHALVGVPPFSDVAPHALTHVRRTSMPKWPADLARDELFELCMRLLQPEPHARADCAVILERLASYASPAPPVELASEAAQGPAFVGRSEELRTLRDALQEAKTKCVAVITAGPPGVGKSCLVQRFLAGLNPDQHIVLLAKCYEQESLPHKTLDGIVDALVKFLQALPELEIALLLPRYALELMLMFPALSRIGTFASAAARSHRIPDDQEQKRRAILALREMLAKLADRATLIICVEDLQWGDRDSAGFIRQLLTSPDTPPCLCLGTVRLHECAEDGDRLTRRLFGGDHIIGSQLATRCIRLNPLSPIEAKELALRMLRDPDDERATRVANEAAGNPLLVRQLAEFANDEPSPLGGSESASLREMVRARAARLSPSAAALLRLVALSGGVLDVAVARAAAALDDDTPSAVHELSSAQLIQTRGVGGSMRLELYHSHLCNAVLQDLEPAELRVLHAKLAAALSGRGTRDDERIVRHLHRAGRRVEAVALAIDCADRSNRALAYERAACMYSLALKLGVPDSQVLTVKIGRAEALRNAGRGRDAAGAFLDASHSTSDRPRAAELRSRAATELLLNGEVAQGRLILRSIVRLPRGRAQTLVALAGNRLRLALRGLRVRARPAGSFAASDLARLDEDWSIAQTLLILDPVLGMFLQSRHLLRALRVGEPTRAVRALALEAVCVSAARGPAARPRVARILRLVGELNESVDQPATRATTAMWTAVAAYLMGQPEQAIAEALRAESVLREECAAVAYELAVVHLAVLRSQMMLGHWTAFCRRVQEAFREALQRGNLYLSEALRTYTHLACLVADDVEASNKEVSAARRNWPQDEVHLQNLAMFGGEARTHLYCGDGVAALQHLNELWPQLQRSAIADIRFVRVELSSLRGRGAALAYAQTRERSHRKTAEDEARCLLKERFRGAAGTALLILSSTEASDSRRQSALRLLDGAASSFERDKLPFFAEVSRYQAAVLGAREDMRAQATARLSEAGVRNCSAFARMYTAHLEC